jgi:transposase
MAVRAVEEKHYSPELIAAIFGISRSRIYDWLRGYPEEGEDALDTRWAPGAPPVITPVMAGWLKPIGLHSTPVEQG